jgi:serine/threonine protein kinase
MTNDKRINRRYGPYHCVGLLEASADSALYHALHNKSGRMVTLRVLSLSRDVKHPEKLAQMKADCVAEIETVQQLNHPHLIPIIDHGTEDYVVYFATPYMKNGNLYQRLRRGNTSRLPDNMPSLGQIAQLTSEVASALQEVHNHGLVHGQVEPRAILIDQGKAYLAEVGLMKLHKIIFHLDKTNSFSVTRYSAPELWEGERPQAASDQYALACITYELITGRAPFEADTLIGLMRSHLDEAVLPPNYVRPELKLPMELSMVFWQALAKPVDRRYASVTEFAEAFREAIGNHVGKDTDFFTFPLSQN